MKRGELAGEVGCNIETIRYYENIGLLNDPPRNENGYRIYGAVHQQRLRFVLRGRELGFSIDQLRELLTLVDGGSYTCAEVRDLTKEHLDTIREKISDLKRLEQTLATTFAECDSRQVPECPVIDALLAGN